MTNAEARFIKSLRPRKPAEGSLGRTAQDVHLDSHTAPELWILNVLQIFQFIRFSWFFQFLENLFWKTTKTLLLTIHNLAAHSHEFAEGILTSYIWSTKPQPCHTQSRICWGHLDRLLLTCWNLSSPGRNYVGSLFTTDHVKTRWLLTFDTFATLAGFVYDVTDTDC